MQIQINNASVAAKVATAAGYRSVEEFVNSIIKREADLQALRQGIADADAGRVRPMDEFDIEFRRERNIEPGAC